MRKLLFIAILFISFPVFADEELYRVERPDGVVSIVHYKSGSQKSLSEALNSFGFSGFPVKKISLSDISTDRTYRNFWAVDPVTRKIAVDQDKKKQFLDAKAAEESQRQAILDKLKISESELDTLVN